MVGVELLYVFFCYGITVDAWFCHRYASGDFDEFWHPVCGDGWWLVEFFGVHARFLRSLVELYACEFLLNVLVDLLGFMFLADYCADLCDAFVDAVECLWVDVCEFNIVLFCPRFD